MPAPEEAAVHELHGVLKRVAGLLGVAGASESRTLPAGHETLNVS